MQELAGMVQAVPHFTEHHSEGLSDGHWVPEVSVVLTLALFHQLMCVLCLLSMHLLCQSLCIMRHMSSADSCQVDASRGAKLASLKESFLPLKL